MAVVPQACTGLVEAIEAGDLDRAGDVAREHVAALLARLPAPQSAVLGCTHYPLVEAAFRDALPAGDRAGLAAGAGRRQPRRLPQAPPATSRGGTGRGRRYLTTGDPAAVGARAAVFTGTPLPFAGRLSARLAD